MKIWIINHYAIPPTQNGGTRHYNLALQLKNRGHDVVIIAANYSHFSHEYIANNNCVGDYDTSHEIPFIWIPVPTYKGNTISRFWNMIVYSYRILSKKYLPRKAKPDVIIGSSPHLFAAFSALLLAKRLRKPFVLEIRDLWPETLVDLGRLTYKHPLVIVMKWIERYLYRNADKIITLLPSANTYLQQCGVAQQNISWLPNAVNMKNVPESEHKSKNEFVFMYSGAHGLANDLETVIAAAKIIQSQSLVHNIKICLIGEGPEKNNLQLVVAKENINNVEFLPSVAKQHVYAVLAHADVFLMLLKDSPVFRWGISPNKLYDYLAMAKPVIFAVNTPFNPIAIAGAGISINPSDPQALATAMLELASTSAVERNAMGTRGRAYVSEHHGVENIAQKLETLLNDLVIA